MASKDAGATHAPELTIVPQRSWAIAQPSELWEFRTLFTRFAARDLTLRYRQTALGVAWVVLQPLLAAGVLTFVFGSVAKLHTPGHVPYFVFSLTGMLGWTAFSLIVTRSSGVLVANAALVSKVFFPRLLLPLSTLASTLVDVSVSALLLAVLIAAYGVTLQIQLLLAPIVMIPFVLLAFGIGSVASALMVRYRDVQYVLPVAVQFLLYASPVAYALAAVPHGARLVFELNPLTGLLEMLRWSILGTPLPPLWQLVYVAVLPIGVFLIGLSTFSRMEREFADVI